MSAGVDVLVVATYGEAQALGARHEGSRWVMPDGRVAISVRSAFRAVDGLRVASVKSTSKAELVPGFDKVMATLERSRQKTAHPSPLKAPLLATRDALADELALHDGYRINEDGWTVCLCGYVAEGDDDDGSHAQHLADVLSGVVVEPQTAKAEALREAADKWQWGQWADAPRRADRVQERIANAQFVGDWLRARAAALTEETP